MASKRKRSRSDSEGAGEGSNISPLENGLEEAGDGGERVVILDAGAQYGKVIDRRVRELFVESVMLPLDTSASEIERQRFRAVIISGGPNSVNDEDAPAYDPALFSLATPILGICYGMQLLNKHYGGSVERKNIREDGQFSITVRPQACPLFSGLDERQMVLLTHGDSIGRLADCLEETARSGELVAAVQHKSRRAYGVQFHPEVELSENGLTMLRSFLYEVAGCHGNYTISNREESCLEYIRKTVGQNNVLSLVSGGVDSAVCTALLNRALGAERVVAVHVDNGFMRMNESAHVKQSLEELGLKVHVVQAAHKFYTAQTVVHYATPVSLEPGGGVAGGAELQQRLTPPLHSIMSPEEKRCVIGDAFMKVADSVIADLQLEADDIFLAQGTLRPDLIESASVLASSNAHVIKTHHNDTQLVRELRQKGRVIEPLKEFHKDEVRALGEALGLPKELVHRHPFPGPGLAIRVICQTDAYIRDDFHSTNVLLEVIADFSRASQTSSALVEGMLRLLSPGERALLTNLTAHTSIAATLLPIYSVGVQGDARTYNYVAALSSEDVVNWEEVMELAKIIPRLCHNINRVVWVFGSVVRGPIEEVTPTYLRPEALATLRQADFLATSVLTKHNALSCVSQMPVVLVPLHFDRAPEAHPAPPSCRRSLVVRTFITSDFMTGIPATPGRQLPLSVLQDLVATLESIPGISRVLYDLTPKPPGTTEWE